MHIYELEFVNIFRILSFNVDPLLSDEEANKLINTVIKAVERNEEASKSNILIHLRAPGYNRAGVGYISSRNTA